MPLHQVVLLLAALAVAAVVVVSVTKRKRTGSPRVPEDRPSEKEVSPKSTKATKPKAVAKVVTEEETTEKPSGRLPAELPPPRRSIPSLDSLPRIDSAKPPQIIYEEDDDAVEPTKVGPSIRASGWIDPPTEKIVYDEDALLDEPTGTQPLILLTATAQTDRGLRRKRNEDSILALKDDGLFVVADGMGGYRGGEIASQLAVDAIATAFQRQTFPGSQHPTIPRRASELARAIQAANAAILERAQQERHLEGMGTTVCAVRFSPKKQRVYVGHVGDSRVYRLREGKLEQMTADHTMADLGVVGEGANHLSRAVGLWPTVPIDILLGKPRPGDVYLLCSDGLTKMVRDEQISTVLSTRPGPQDAAEELISVANANGGKDNISVVVVRVEPAHTRMAS